MSDIVQRLQDRIGDYGKFLLVDGGKTAMLMKEAVAEIETIRAQLAAAEKEITDAHAALAEMPVEPFRSIGGQTWDLAARIRHADGMWRVADAELAASDRPVQSYIDNILVFAAGSIVGSFIILAILVLAGASNAE